MDTAVITRFAVLAEPGWARDALCALLGTAVDFQLVSACRTADEVLALVPAPALVVLDTRDRQPKSLLDARRLSAKLPSAGLLCLTNCSVQRHVDALFNAGVRGCVGPRSPAEALFEAMRAVARGERVTLQLAQRFPRAALLCMARCAEQRQVDDFIAAGARGCVLEGAEAKDLFNAIRAVAHGERLVPRVTEQHAHLSPRETDVLHWLAQGLTSKEIATRLDVAVSTVETYRKQLMTKLDLHSVATLTRFAIRSGIAPLE